MVQGVTKQWIFLFLLISMHRVIKSEYLSYQISPGITKQHQCKVLVDAVYSSVRHQSKQATDVGEHPQDANVDILSTVLHISYKNNVWFFSFSTIAQIVIVKIFITFKSFTNFKLQYSHTKSIISTFPSELLPIHLRPYFKYVSWILQTQELGKRVFRVRSVNPWNVYIIYRKMFDYKYLSILLCDFSLCP